MRRPDAEIGSGEGRHARSRMVGRSVGHYCWRHSRLHALSTGESRRDAHRKERAGESRARGDAGARRHDRVLGERRAITTHVRHAACGHRRAAGPDLHLRNRQQCVGRTLRSEVGRGGTLDLGWWGVALAIIAGAIRVSTPYLLVSLGETLTEKSGRVNLGLEGTLVLGAMTGFSASGGPLQRMFDMPHAVTAVLQGLIFICVIASNASAGR